MNEKHAENSVENNIIDKAAENDAEIEEKPQRRLQDGIKSKNPKRKMNLDRRSSDHDRRSITGDSDYKGPSRRYTIDRRQKTRDRREND